VNSNRSFWFVSVTRTTRPTGYALHRKRKSFSRQPAGGYSDGGRPHRSVGVPDTGRAARNARLARHDGVGGPRLAAGKSRLHSRCDNTNTASDNMRVTADGLTAWRLDTTVNPCNASHGLSASFLLLTLCGLTSQKTHRTRYIDIYWRTSP